MSRRLLFFLLALCVCVMPGCQASSEQPAPKTEITDTDEQRTKANEGEAGTESFQPYTYAEVPPLKQLVLAEGFEAYTSKQPYLLGYSYDGHYVATIVYRPNLEGYLIDVVDTTTNHTAYNAFVPNMERILNGDQVNIDLLSSAQESLDLGYRIKVVPVVQQGQRFEQRDANGDEVYHFELAVEDQAVFRVSVHDKANHTWHAIRTAALFTNHQTVANQYTWAFHPHVPERVTIMVYTEREGQLVDSYVYTIRTDSLDDDLSEQALQATFGEWLDNPRIVYRFPSTAAPLSVLAVGGEDDGADKAGTDGMLYADSVPSFALLDREGKMALHANETGIFDHEDQPLTDSERAERYHIVLVPGSIPGEAQLLVVDVFGENDQLMQTMQWQWSDEDRQFIRIKTGEEQQNG